MDSTERILEIFAEASPFDRRRLDLMLLVLVAGRESLVESLAKFRCEPGDGESEIPDVSVWRVARERLPGGEYEAWCRFMFAVLIDGDQVSADSVQDLLVRRLSA